MTAKKSSINLFNFSFHYGFEDSGKCFSSLSARSNTRHKLDFVRHIQNQSGHDLELRLILLKYFVSQFENITKRKVK